MVPVLLFLLTLASALLFPLLVIATAWRLSGLPRERLEGLQAPARPAFTPSGFQALYEFVVGGEHRAIGDGLLSGLVWTLRGVTAVGAAAWLASWFVGG